MITLHRTTLAGLHLDEPTPASVQAALQRAIELEHATIPVYLYAFFSLDPARNAEAAAIIKSVVVEEMLHMVLAANVLNAIGGAPAISHRRFIPTYPSHLPGGVEGQLQLHLRPFSDEQLEAFIEIEEPRDPIDYEAHAALVEVPSVTIGEFYATIAAAVTRLAPEAFDPAPRRQVGPDLMFGSVTVTDATSAVEALETIVAQGEGTSTSPQEIDGPNGVNDFAHFYRLSELKHRRRLVQVIDPASPRTTYAFAGDPIHLDPGGIIDLPADPSSRDHPEGSPARRQVDTFNATYTALLGQLHKLLNGHNDMASFMASLTTMSTLEDQARAMAAGSETSGVPVGPSFEHRPDTQGLA